MKYLKNIYFLFSDSLPPPGNLEIITEKVLSNHYLILVGLLKGVRLFTIYKHPSFSKSDFLRVLGRQLEKHSSEPLLVFGDMNIDFSCSSNTNPLDFFQKFGLKSCLSFSESTTDYNTHLDVCFSNVQNIKCTIYENYYSYHKSLSIKW